MELYSFSLSNYALWPFLAFFFSLLIAVSAQDVSRRYLEEGEEEGEQVRVTISSGLTITSMVLGLISSLLCILALIFVISFRKRTIVALGQPPFLCLICIGSLMVGSKNLFESPKAVVRMGTLINMNLDTLCIIKLWLLDVGLIIVYMSFFCKLWRTEKVCQFRKNQIIHVSHVIGPFVFILLLQIGLLTAMTILAPPFWTWKVPMKPHDSSNTDVVEKCYQYQFSNRMNMAFNIATLAVVIICQAITIWMSYKTRKIREDISDSRRIFQTVVFQILICFPYTLVVNGAFTNADGTFVFLYEAMYPFLMSVSSVGFLVFPKIHCILYQRKFGQLPSYARTIGGGVHVSITSSSLRTNSTPITRNATSNEIAESRNNDQTPQVPVRDASATNKSILKEGMA